jgi:hypothetical protein
LLRDKVDAIGFGFQIPIFPVTSGIKGDVSASARPRAERTPPLPSPDVGAASIQ